MAGQHTVASPCGRQNLALLAVLCRLHKHPQRLLGAQLDPLPNDCKPRVVVQEGVVMMGWDGDGSGGATASAGEQFESLANGTNKNKHVSRSSFPKESDRRSAESEREMETC